MPLHRRAFLSRTGSGFGAVALAHLLGAEHARGEGLHHPAKVRRVIHLFMNGGASPMDTFDHKPKLAELDGKKFDPGGSEKVESVTNSPGFKVLKTPFKF